MNAKIQKEGDVLVVYLDGTIDFDSTEPFRKTVLTHLKEQKVIFNLKDLSFVGSNGITPFIETMTQLCELNRQGVRFCNIGSEFRRIFEASEIKNLEIYESEHLAKRSFFESIRSALQPEANSSVFRRDSVLSIIPIEDTESTGEETIPASDL